MTSEEAEVADADMVAAVAAAAEAAEEVVVVARAIQTITEIGN